MNTEYDKAVSRAKIQMMRMPQTMFLATVCCSLETKADSNVAFAATNGTKLLINPERFMSLSDAERTFLLAHETMHVVYKHMLRLNGRDKEKWNDAADYLINGQLIEQGFTIIDGGLYDRKFNDKSADDIYNIIMQGNVKTPDSNPMSGDLHSPDANQKGEDGNDDDDQSEGNSEGSTSAMSEQAIENAIDSLVMSAAQVADMRGEAGSVPGSVRRHLDMMAKPKVDWKAALRRFMHALDKSDYSWARPNKRYTEFYLPHMRGQSISQLSFAIDTSGSVSKDEFNQFISEVHSVMKQLKPKKLQLMQFDHALQYDEIITSVHELSKVPFKGHGGTNPSVALNSFSKSASKALIMLTDGQFYTENLPKPNRPVLWVIFNNPNWEAPYGKVIHIELDK